MDDEEFFAGFMSDGNKIETDLEQEMLERWKEEARTKERSQRRGFSTVWIWLGFLLFIGLILVKSGII